MKKWQNVATICGGALLTVAPQIIAVLPGKYRDLATALIAALVAAWHLYQPSPSQQR
jgi:hypothetical protein